MHPSEPISAIIEESNKMMAEGSVQDSLRSRGAGWETCHYIVRGEGSGLGKPPCTTANEWEA
jgi:hypothetical protein